MIWVYAVCERPEKGAPRGHGLAQAPLEGIVERQLLAVVTRHPQTPAGPAPDALWEHERVVERLMAERAVLPMRFGTTLPEAGALRAALAARHAELLAALERVRRRVELGVRAVDIAGSSPPPPPPTPPASGREYVLAKLAHTTRAERTAEALHRPLAALAVDGRRHPVHRPREVLRGSYLVDRAEVAAFRAAVERLQRERPAVALLCTGPWPPYSFVPR